MFLHGVCSRDLTHALVDALTVLAMRWKGKGCPVPCCLGHAEIAATEQAQREAARAKRGERLIRRALTAHFDPRTHRRRTDRDGGRSPASNRFQALSTLLPPRGSSVTLLV